MIQEILVGYGWASLFMTAYWVYDSRKGADVTLGSLVVNFVWGFFWPFWMIEILFELLGDLPDVVILRKQK